MRIQEIFTKKKPVLSFEIFPPKRDSELKDIDETLAILSKLSPDFISVTFGAGGSSNNNKTIEIAKKIKHQYGIETLVHLTCSGYTKQEIDSFISILSENGIENILALRGDKNPNVLEKSDFQYASELTGYLNKSANFCIAGACYPECHPESKNRISEISHLKGKVDAGSDFLISQLFFENEFFYSFIENCRIAGINVPVTAGIMPVINKAQIERIVNLCGASLPNRFRKIINRYENEPTALFDAGMSYALSQVIDLLVNDVDGIHLYTMNNPIVAKRICEGIKNII